MSSIFTNFIKCLQLLCLMTLLIKLFSAGHTFTPPQLKTLAARASVISKRSSSTRPQKPFKEHKKQDLKPNNFLDDLKEKLKSILHQEKKQHQIPQLKKLTILFGGERQENEEEQKDSYLNDDVSSLKMTKVVTDIDDTVVSSGGYSIFGIALGGVDNQYQRGQFYPGCIQFALEVSLDKLKTTTTAAMTSSSTSSMILPAKISVLTARAKEFKFALALKEDGKLNRAYRSLGKQNGVENWGIGDVYYGSVVEWVLQHRKGIRKSDNFGVMIEEDEKAGRGIGQYVFIGDTGEKDYEAGERMAKKYPDRLKAIFMHNVYKINKINDKGAAAPTAAVSSLKSLDDKVINGVPVIYFRTYVGAAIKAYERHMISKEALKRIAAQSIIDLQKVTEKPLKDSLHLHRNRSKKSFFPVKLTIEVDRLSPKSYLQELIWERRKARIESQWNELIADMEQVPFLRQYIPEDRQVTVSNERVDVLAMNPRRSHAVLPVRKNIMRKGWNKYQSKASVKQRSSRR